MAKLFKCIIFWLFFMGFYCNKPPSMHPESMDAELELVWDNLNGYAIIEIEIVKGAQQSGSSNTASDDFAQMKISVVPQDPLHSNAYRGHASGRDGVGTFADSHFMASELYPNGTLPNNGRKRSSKRSHSLGIEVIHSTPEKFNQYTLAVPMLFSEGFEEHEEESRAPASKKPAPTIALQLSTPITKPAVEFPKKPPVVSNSFMNALSAGSSVNAMELQRKRKKPPPVIDLPLSSPLDPVVITPTISTASVAGTVPLPDPLDPDPTRVPAPSARRRIHFADDKGEALVHTKFIENVLNNKAHHPNSDMKHADAEAERISLRMEMPEIGNTEVDSSWRLIPYYKNTQNQFSQDLIDEEEARHGNVMRTLVTQLDIPIEHPSEPDDVENAVIKFWEPHTIPIDFVMEETVEQKPVEVDAPASPDTLSANVSTVSPVPVPNFAPPHVSRSSFPVNNFQVLNNIDVKNMHSVPPPPISRHEPQPVPPPSTELTILGDEPRKINASNLSNNSAIDANSFLRGTEKLTNYEVISNEANLPLSDIQSFTHGICYTHQIVASAVSLPDQYLLPMNLLNMEEIIWLVIAMLPMSLSMIASIADFGKTILVKKLENLAKSTNN